MLTGPKKLHNVLYIDWDRRIFYEGNLSEGNIEAGRARVSQEQRQFPDVIFQFNITIQKKDGRVEKFRTDDIWVLETPGPGMKER